MDSIKLWIGEVCESRESENSYRVAIKCFEAWAQENHGFNVAGIPERWRTVKYQDPAERERFVDELRDLLRAYFAYLKDMYTPIAVNSRMSTVMSFLHNWEIPVKSRRLRYPYVVYHNRDIKKEEIRRLLEHTDVRNQAIFLILYESGMRPNTLVNLRWRHIKEEFLEQRIPMKINLTSDILKCRVSERWTFIGEDGYKALKRYLTTEGLPQKDEEFVFTKEKPAGGQLGRTALSQSFNKLVKKLGLAEPRGPGGKKPKEIRLYCLRKAFDKYLDADEAYKEYWTGHTSTMTHYVSSDPEHHRKLYAEGYESLRLFKQIDAEVIAKLTKENADLTERVDRLEKILGEIADLKAQIKREEGLLNHSDSS